MDTENTPKNLGADAPVFVTDDAYTKMAGELAKCYNKVAELISPKLQKTDFPETEGSIRQIYLALIDLHQIVYSLGLTFDLLVQVADRQMKNDLEGKDDGTKSNG